MTRVVSQRLRQEALGILENRSAILDLARELSRLMKDAGVTGAVIGGISVVLHGHVRTTTDVNLFIDGPLERLAMVLLANNFTFDAVRREFMREQIPVPLVTIQQLGKPPRETVEIDGVTTVSLADLVEMKLRSGSENLLRAQDLADAIGLIRHHRLTGEFARHLDSTLRPTYRQLVKELNRERKTSD